GRAAAALLAVGSRCDRGGIPVDALPPRRHAPGPAAVWVVVGGRHGARSYGAGASAPRHPDDGTSLDPRDARAGSGRDDGRDPKARPSSQVVGDTGFEPVASAV